MDATTDEEYCTWMPASFLSALMAIVVIDIVLAGDNAIVIALAARQPARRTCRKRPSSGARSAPWACVWVLTAGRGLAASAFPGLLAVGGALLVWIAWKLLQPDEGSDQRREPRAGGTGFWGAIPHRGIADTIMGLDNVLAVAGAAHGTSCWS